MKFSLITWMVLAGVAFGSCNQQEKFKDLSDAADEDMWIEMDSFHLIMTEAFHPFTDADNLEPVKRIAEKLAQQADTWDIENLTPKVNTDEIKAQIIQLRADTRALAEMIKIDASDEDIGLSINAIHDNFHLIMLAWHAEASVQ